MRTVPSSWMHSRSSLAVQPSCTSWPLFHCKQETDQCLLLTSQLPSCPSRGCKRCQWLQFSICSSGAPDCSPLQAQQLTPPVSSPALDIGKGGHPHSSSAAFPIPTPCSSSQSGCLPLPADSQHPCNAALLLSSCRTEAFRGCKNCTVVTPESWRC